MPRLATKSNPALTKATAARGARARFPVWLLAVLLVLVTIALYWPATGYDFVNYDDPEYVTANPQVQSGWNWEGVKWAFLSPVCANWHPLTVLSHMLACRTFGLHPWGHHLTNILLHALNAGLVFALLQQMTGAIWRSVLVAALFALHPLRVESVAWVAERKDVLSGFFGLLALMAYVRYAQRPVISNQWSVISLQSSGVPAPHDGPRTPGHRSLFYLLSLGCFALGLMSKPMLVTWPFVMLLLDYWPLGRRQKAQARDTHHAPRTTHHASPFTDQSQIANRKSEILLPLLVEKLPFFVLAALVSTATFVVQKQGGAVKSVVDFSLGARAGNALVSYCRYLGKLFWPKELAVFYPHPGDWPLGKVLLAGAVIAGISAVVWVQRRRYPFSLVGWLWFVGMLVPMIGLVQSGGWAMADRHTYLPSLGVLILTVWGAGGLCRSWWYQALASSVAGGVAILLCLALTRQQLGHWKDSETIFVHALKVTANNYVAHINLGNALDEQGRIDEAITQFQETIRLIPNYAMPHYSLGVDLSKKGRMDEAICQFQECLRLKPDYVAHNSLGYALQEKGQTDEAIRQFQEAIHLNPNYPMAHYNLGLARLREGRADEAIRQFQEAIRLRPDDADAHNNLGYLLLKNGHFDEAVTQFQEAIRLNPNHTPAHNNLGLAFAGYGETDAAIQQFQEAIRLKPDFAEARRNLRNALLKKGQTDGPATQ